MWRNALRDLQWRRRRLLISNLGTSLVFTMALVLAGLSGGFNTEANNATKAFGADAWFVHAGTPGPITSGLPLSESGYRHRLSSAGGDTGCPVWSTPANRSDREAQSTDANLFGVESGKVGSPVPVSGRQPADNSEAMVDDALPLQDRSALRPR